MMAAINVFLYLGHPRGGTQYIRPTGVRRWFGSTNSQFCYIYGCWILSFCYIYGSRISKFWVFAIFMGGKFRISAIFMGFRMLYLWVTNFHQVHHMTIWPGFDHAKALRVRTNFFVGVCETDFHLLTDFGQIVRSQSKFKIISLCKVWMSWTWLNRLINIHDVPIGSFS